MTATSVLRSRSNVCVLATALFYMLFANYSALRVQNRNDLALLCGTLLLSFLNTYMLFAILALRPLIYTVFVPPLFFIGALVAYYTTTYGVYISLNTIAVVYETNVHEALGFIDARLVVWLIVSQLFACVAIAAYRKTHLPPLRPRLALAGALLVMVPVSAILGSAGADFVPINVIVQTRDYFVERARLAEAMHHKIDIAPRFRYEGDPDLTVVVIVGESARADHFHINGYPRQTSPRIESLGVVSFPDVWSCSSGTRFSVPCIFRRGTPETWMDSRESGLISVFRGLGFHTAWLSNQGYLGLNSTLVTSVGLEAETVTYNNRTGTTYNMRVLDEELLPYLDTELADRNPRQLIALHTVGSHWFYESHYPDAFRVFQPVCSVKSPAICGERLVNSYDNAILHTDHIIAEVIRRVEHRNALVLYVADHGESLGEDGVYIHTHGNDRREQRQVPLFVWMSPTFAARHPEARANLAARTVERVTHHHVFHTLLDCAGATSPLLDPRLSLCRPPAPR